MKIAFYKSKKGKWLDKAISAVTLSQYSHCELIFSDGICASASPRDGGVRFKYITMGEKWDVYELPKSFNEIYAREWFIRHEEQSYDYLGAFGSAFNLDLTSPDKKFCSYACALALKLKDPIVSPGDLYDRLRQQRLISCITP